MSNGNRHKACFHGDEKMKIPYFLTSDESSGDSSVVLSALGSSRVSMTNDNFGQIYLDFLGAKATSKAFLIEIENSYQNRKLSNRAIHANTILGENGRPFQIPKPIIIGKNHALFLTLTDLSGSTNTIRFFLQGEKNDIQPKEEKEYSFFYTTDASVSLSSLGTATEYISIDYGDFLISKLLVYSDGIFKFKISDARNGLRWSNGWIHSYALGYSEYNNLFSGKKIEKNSKLKIEFEDLSSSTNNIYFTLCGVNL